MGTNRCSTIIFEKERAARTIGEETTKTGTKPIATVAIVTFGFKYGPPPTNYAFDVSFLRNPARETQWGLFAEPDDEMRTFVMEQSNAQTFLDRLTPMVEALATFDDGVRIGLGCSGGRHRSRIIADALAEKLRAKDIAVNIIHPEGSMHQ